MNTLSVHEQKTEYVVSPEALMRLSWFYLAAKPFILACEAHLFTWVGLGVNTAEQLAKSAVMKEEVTSFLLESMTAIELLDADQNGSYRNTKMASQYLDSASDMYIGDAILKLSSGNNSGEPKRICNTANNSVSEFDEKTVRVRDTEIIDGTAIHGLTSGSSMAFGRFYDFADGTHLLDIAGGVAGTAMWTALSNSDLQITILDTPSVCSLGRAYVNSANLGGRITFLEGDIFASEYPSEPDIHFCTNTFHGFTPEACKRVIGKSYKVLPEKGKLILHDRVLAKEAPPYSPIINSGMLMMHQHSLVHSPEDYKTWMTEIGFSEVGEIEIAGIPGFAYGIK